MLPVTSAGYNDMVNKLQFLDLDNDLLLKDSHCLTNQNFVAVCDLVNWSFMAVALD